MFVPLVGLLMGRSAGRGGRGGSKRGVNGANSCRAGWSCDGSGPRIIALFIGNIGLLHWGKFLVESVTSPSAPSNGPKRAPNLDSGNSLKISVRAPYRTPASDKIVRCHPFRADGSVDHLVSDFQETNSAEQPVRVHSRPVANGRDRPGRRAPQLQGTSPAPRLCIVPDGADALGGPAAVLVPVSGSGSGSPCHSLFGSTRSHDPPVIDLVSLPKIPKIGENRRPHWYLIPMRS